MYKNILGDHTINIWTTQHLAKADIDSPTDTGGVIYQVIACNVCTYNHWVFTMYSVYVQSWYYIIDQPGHHQQDHPALYQSSYW